MSALAAEAREPAERRGLARDGVRLLVAHSADRTIEHRHFFDLPDLLEPGDLLVVNVSSTLPAAVVARRGDLRVHFSTRVPGLDDRWRVVELRSPDGSTPLKARTGQRIALPGGAELELAAPYLAGGRLVVARLHGAVAIEPYLERHGEPIRYGYVAEAFPLEAYQNVYARIPGSSEMPSAGRPFTAELMGRLVAKDVEIAPLTLHAGVSSPERHEPPFPEEFEVPETTALRVNAARRVIAVGTTVVRALETQARPNGKVLGGAGWTKLVITPERGLRAVDGLITGWHEPESSHLVLLQAAAGGSLLERSYEAAVTRGYLWHEFGDSYLVLP
ncbi:MAG TPA: S-adenosylmethionine:tRNA ribosyltransferase-isomerase [Solirubrobacteraceae bacterium]|nr:S-adenosylmethionine:tRNA ribosyltransferase-isomerase [Solirubrobacteraceae bacterium]